MRIGTNLQQKNTLTYYDKPLIMCVKGFKPTVLRGLM